MTREQAAAAFLPVLEGLTHVWDGTTSWPLPSGAWLGLRFRLVVSDLEPPTEMVSSARAVVFRRGRVVVVRDLTEAPHVVPGGRLEPGETVEAAVRREVMEETGWSVGPLTRFGFYHFHHTDPEPPPGFAFPWCDFVQPLHVAEGLSYAAAHRDRTQIELGSRLMSLRAARAQLPEDQVAILDAALAARSSRA